MSDPIADLIIRIKNAYLARHSSLTVSSSKAKLAIAKVLESEGKIKSVRVEEDAIPRPQLYIELSYTDSVPSLTNVRQVSKPGSRVYVKATKIPRVLGGLGFSIVSTPRGILSDKEARKQNVGGEIICQVW